MRDPAIDGRALALFELLSDHPGERERLLRQEPPAVAAAVLALEEAAPRARAAFPTEEDALPRRHVLPLPEHVGAYRLGARLGEGGMGLVFAADRCDGLFEHRAAAKLIHPDRFSDAALARFAAERQLLARLDHPGIARLVDGGVTGEGWPFILMERVDGLTIDQAAAALPLPERVALVAQVCDAVSAAHAALIVHGDIKPANVLVDPVGRARLLDFGVARLIDDAPDPAPGPRTAAFASPAVLAGGAPGVADDVYAIGVLLRAVACADRADSHLQTPANADLAAIAALATAVSPERRYRSVDAIAMDLARWRQGKPVSARAATWRYVLGCFIRRNRTALAAAAVGLTALALLAGVATAGWQRARERQAVVLARTGDLRQLARYQLFDLAARLEHQPRSIALRRDLVREADQVLASALAAPGASAALRLEAARGYRLLATVEGAPNRPSLGDTAAANRSLARAAALLRGDGAPAARAQLAGVLLDRAQLAGWSGRTDAAMALLNRAQALVPANDRQLADDLALTRADTLTWKGDYAGARQVLEPLAARMRTPPRTLDAVLRRDRFGDRLAEATYYGGDIDGALAIYRAAAADLTAAQPRWPGEPTLTWAAARQAWNIGTTLVELGRPAEARPWLEQSRRIMAAEVANDPADAMAARRLRSYQLALAQADAGLGRYPAAIAALEGNVAARARWQREAPGNSERSRDLAIAVAALGDVQAQAGHRDEACRRYRQVHAIHAGLANRSRLSQLDSGYFANLVAASERRLQCSPEPRDRTAG